MVRFKNGILQLLLPIRGKKMKHGSFNKNQFSLTIHGGHVK